MSEKNYFPLCNPSAIDMLPLLHNFSSSEPLVLHICFWHFVCRHNISVSYIIWVICSRCLFCFSCCTNWYNVKEKKEKKVIWDVQGKLNLSSLKYKYKTHWMIRRVFILKNNEIFNSHYGSLNYFNNLFQTFQRYSVLNIAKNNFLNFLNWTELLFYVCNSKNCMSLTCKVMFPEGNEVFLRSCVKT